MRSRLGALGAGGVRARTFHSAALGLLRRYAPTPPERILASKALVLRRIANRLPAPYKFRPAADLATEIEWAKNRRIGPEAYLYGVDGHEPVIPADLMARVFRDYERWKQAEGWVDFEDVLELAVRLLDDDPHALADLRERYRAFTVDEYQDVNLLQQALLDLWLGASDELCAVGDDYQSIYGFTGATPEYLLALPRRFPHAAVVRLETNYRSTPQVLALANRLVPTLGGAEKTLRASRAGRPGARRAAVRPTSPPTCATGWRRSTRRACPLEEMAVLVRTNARTVDFESAFARGGHRRTRARRVLERDAARQLLKRVRGAASPRLPRCGASRSSRAGWSSSRTSSASASTSARPTSRGWSGWPAVATGLVRRVGRRSCARASAGDAGRGVHLLTLHRAKGLEWDAVFLPRVEEKELPFKLAKTAEEQAEERRLFYVGMTRARRYLTVTWSGQAEPLPARARRDRGGEGCRAAPGAGRRPIPRTRSSPRSRRGGSSAPRRTRSPPTSSSTTRRSPRSPSAAPRSLAELAAVPGVGPAKLERYGADVLSALAAGAAASAPAA